MHGRSIPPGLIFFFVFFAVVGLSLEIVDRVRPDLKPERWYPYYGNYLVVKCLGLASVPVVLVGFPLWLLT